MSALILALALAGTVVAPDGSPVAGAQVRVLSSGVVATANDAGAFTIDAVELPAEVMVSAPGFAAARVRVTSSPVILTLLPRAAEASVLVTAPMAPAGAVSLTRETLSLAPALTTDERLRSVAGFSLFRRSSSRQANPTTHGVTMRGLSASGASRGLVVLDGIPLNDGFGAWVTWTRVPAAALDRVDVLAGASGDLFGSDALGGVIRLQAPSWSRPAASAQFEGGTFETWSTDAAAGGAVGRVSWFGAASFLDTAGSVPLEPASAGAVDRPADAQWWNGYGRMEVTQGASRWTVFGFGGRDDRGNGTVLQRNRMEGGTVAGAFVRSSAATTVAARVSWSPNGFDQTFTAVATGRASEFLTSTQRIEATTTRAALELARTSARWFGVIRGTLSRATADFREIRPAGTTDAALRDDGESVSAQWSWTGQPDVTVSAGGRVEWRAAPDAAQSRDRATVGRLSAEWRARPGLRVHGSAATSHRWPTLNELARGFRVGNAQTLPNPNLQPERAVSFEAGATWDAARVRLGATAFRAVVHDAIANVTLPSLTGIVRERQNAGDAVSTGVEADLEWRVGRAVRLTSSLTWVDASFENSREPAIEGKQLPQVPDVSATVSGLVTHRWMSATVLLRTTGHQFDDDRNTFRLAPATQVDATVSGRVRSVRVFVAGENLLDARIETGRTPLVTLAPGRAVRAGVQVLFGDLRR